ncbi:MAG: acetyl-CoA carboxylase carboxyltransferase subunit [Deltaproteobacteria bacterium]|nr:acetyl-CoA carboxylase carboxyltransferase subunit [Deltaproteobacteria bacterium]
MGGPERLARQHADGRLDARQRIEALCDVGSFAELGALAGGCEPGGAVPADAYVCGTGAIEGRIIAVGAEDFSVMGGSIGTPGSSKRERLARLAVEERMPFVAILDGAGARASKALDRHVPGPIDLQRLAEASGIVPTVSLVAGASAGHGALTAALSDFVVLVEGHGALFTAGPPLVLASIGETVDKQSLGGAAVHARTSGVAQLAVPDERAGLDAVRRYLSYFPSSAWERPPWRGPEQGNADVAPRRLDAILELVPANPRRPYDVRPVIELLADRGSVLEIQPEYAPGIVTSLVRIGGHSTAIVANQPAVRGGAIDARGADKAARFLEIASSFHMPVVFLADNPGVLAGSESERAGILRAGARMYVAQQRIRETKIHVTLRKAFGFGAPIMGMNLFDGRTRHYAFPGVSLATMPAKAGGALAKAGDETRAELEAAESAGPWKLASETSYDDVIDPRALRDVLIGELARARRTHTSPVEPLRRTGHRP